MRKTFDDIIRRRWEGQLFPVDDRHRQQMIELLEGKKKRRAFAFWWWGAGAVVLVAGYLLWLTTTTITQPNTEATAENAAAVSEASNLATNAVPTTNTTSPEKPVAKTNRTDESSLKQADEVNPSTKNINSENTTIQPSKNNSFQPSTSSTKQTGQLQNKQQGFALQQSSPSSTPTSVIAEHVVAVKKNDQDKSVQPVSGDANTSLIQPSESGSFASLAEIVVETPQPVPPMLSTAWLNALPIEALLITTDHQVGIIEPASKIKHPMYAFAEAGVGAILGSQPKYPSGWKVNAGAGIGYLVQPKLHLMLSGGYLLQDGGFDFERTSTLHSLSFGARSQINSLKPDRLHYVYGKLGMQYRIKKHHIGGSVEAQWMYGAQGVINIQTDDQLTGSSDNPRNAWLSLNGLNRWQYNAGVQYGYRLTPHLSVTAGTQFYFTSLTRQDPALQAEGYNWKGNTAKVQPFITFNYLLYGPF